MKGNFSVQEQDIFEYFGIKLVLLSVKKTNNKQKQVLKVYKSDKEVCLEYLYQLMIAYWATEWWMCKDNICKFLPFVVSLNSF